MITINIDKILTGGGISHSKVMNTGKEVWSGSLYQLGTTYSMASVEWWNGKANARGDSLVYHVSIMLEVPSGATQITTFGGNSYFTANNVYQVFYDVNKTKLSFNNNSGNQTSILNIPSNVAYIVLAIQRDDLAVSQIWNVTFKFT